MRKRTIYEGRIINVRVYEGRLPGREGEARREIVEHRGAAAILAFVEGEEEEGGRKVVMVEQDRFPHGRTLEIPAGTLEEGEGPSACAARELEEETGYLAGKMEPLVSFYPSIGYSTEIIHCFVATDLRPATDNGRCRRGPDDDECITVHMMDWEEVLRMARSGRLQDSKTICAVLTYAAGGR